MDVPGLITTFSPLITEMEVYYDVDDKYGPVRFPSGIEEKYSDFTQRFKTRQICDPGQVDLRRVYAPPGALDVYSDQRRL